MKTLVTSIVLLPLAAAATQLKDMTPEAVKSDGWTLALDVNLADVKSDEKLYEIPGALTLSVREAGKDPSLDDYDRMRGNYLNFRGADGRSFVVEAVVPGPAGRVGLPLAVTGRANCKSSAHRIVLDWKNHRFQISCGRRADFDFPWKNPGSFTFQAGSRQSRIIFSGSSTRTSTQSLPPTTSLPSAP